MKFCDVIGHEEAKSTLRHLVDSNRIPHAILLAGHSGIGKMRLARAFAQYIHCTDPHDGEPCGRCPACLQHQSFNCPDIYFTYPIARKNSKHPVSTDYFNEWKEYLNENSYMPFEAWVDMLDCGNTQPVIYVDEADEISRRAVMSALTSKYKIFLVWLPEKMNPETANKLLKLIEEPFSDTIFIFVSNEPDRILPTVYSRTRRLMLRPLPENMVADWLMKEKGLDLVEADAVAALSGGSLNGAMQAASEGGELSEFGDLYRTMMRMAYSRQVGSLKSIAENIASMRREKGVRFLVYCIRMTRENFISNLGVPPLVKMTRDERAFSVRFAPFINERNVEAIISETERAKNDISRNANAKIVMFDFLLRLMVLLRR